MKFVEIDLFGVYVSPMAIMLVAAYLILMAIRLVGIEAGLFRWVWHPALFQFGIYMIILSCLVLAFSLWGLHV